MGEMFPTPSTLAELEGMSSENITLRAHHVATKMHVHLIEWFLLGHSKWIISFPSMRYFLVIDKKLFCFNLLL